MGDGVSEELRILIEFRDSRGFVVTGELSVAEAGDVRRQIARQMPVTHGHRYVYRYEAIAQREDGSLVRMPSLSRLSATPCYASMARDFAAMVEEESEVFVSASITDGPFAYFDSESQRQAMRRTQETEKSLQNDNV